MCQSGIASDCDHQLRQRLRRGGIWTLVCRSGGIVAVMTVHILLARSLTAEDFGAFVIASSLAVCFSMLAMFGLNTLLCRYVAESLAVDSPRRAALGVWLSIRIGAVSLLVAAIAGGTCAHLLGEYGFDMPQLSRVSVAVAVWILLLAAGQMIAELFRGLHHLFAASALGGVTGGLVSNFLFLALLAVAAARGELSFDAAVMLVLPASFAAVVIGGMSLYLFAWPRVSATDHDERHDLPTLSLRHVLGDAWPIALVQTVSFAVAQLDIWTVARFADEADLAFYAVARRVSLLVALPLTLVSLAIASSISELHARRDKQRLSKIVRGAANVSTAITLLLISGILFNAEGILALGFGSTYAAGAGALRILCVGQLVYVLSGPSGVMLMMTGHQQIPLRITLATLPLYLLGPWAVVRYGADGMALVSASYLVFNNLLQWIAVRRSLGNSHARHVRADSANSICMTQTGKGRNDENQRSADLCPLFQ